MNKLQRFAVVAALALATLTLAGGASAAGGRTGQSNNRHEDTVAYWTPERVAKAKPRDLFVDQSGKIVRGAKPEKGKPGGGGGGTATVTGAAWSGGGLIQKTEGKVLFTMAGVDYVCSGTVVRDSLANGSDPTPPSSLVLTAGHCVYDEVDGWATNWMFMPAFEEAPSSYSNGGFDCSILNYGCWTADALITSQGWRTGNFNEDYAFAVMGPGGKTGTAQLDAAVGFQEIAFSQTRPASVYAFGYPHAAPYNGQDLIYCAGNTIADTFGGSTSAGLNCNMTGGSSGGGWMSPFSGGTGTLVSVNSFKYTGGPLRGYMFGPRFDGDALNTYNAALTASVNTFR